MLIKMNYYYLKLVYTKNAAQNEFMGNLKHSTMEENIYGHHSVFSQMQKQSFINWAW